MTSKTEMYGLVDRLTNNAVALCSVFHFLETYGALISADEWQQKRARMRGNVLAHQNVIEQLAKAVNQMKQPTQ